MTVLIISAHPDDEVLGCGGTISKLSAKGEEIIVYIVSEGTTAQYDRGKINTKREISNELKRILGIKDIIYGDLPDAELDTVGCLKINKEIEKILHDYDPESIFIQYGADINQDHRAVFDSSAVVSRPFPRKRLKRVLSYEVPSSTEWGNLFYQWKPFNPNYFIDVSDHIEKKIEAMSLYKIELRQYPYPRSFEGIRNLASYRGQSAGVPYAEAFNVQYWKD